MSDLDQWRAEVEARLKALEAVKARGRQARKILVSEEGICGLDPERYSATCPDANLYRHRQGCRGTACKNKATAYYKSRRVERGDSVG